MNGYTAGKAWKEAKAQRILEEGYKLFSQRGIELVSIPDVAKAAGVGTATVFRYFSTKLELVMEIAIRKWEAYIDGYLDALSPEAYESLTGAQRMKLYLDSFLDLYRSHPDILRFNYNFNSYLRNAAERPEQKRPYLDMVARLGARFHAMYQRGIEDGTLNADIPEQNMLSSSLHIMLAAATRYAVGLVIVYGGEADPQSELVMLEELLLSRYTSGRRAQT